MSRRQTRTCVCVTHQQLLQVDGPDDGVVADSDDDEEQEGQLAVAHLPHAAVVEDRLPPIRKSVDQDVIVPARTHRGGWRPGRGATAAARTARTAHLRRLSSSFRTS